MVRSITTVNCSVTIDTDHYYDTLISRFLAVANANCSFGGTEAQDLSRYTISAGEDLVLHADYIYVSELNGSHCTAHVSGSKGSDLYTIGWKHGMWSAALNTLTFSKIYWIHNNGWYFAASGNTLYMAVEPVPGINTYSASWTTASFTNGTYFEWDNTTSVRVQDGGAVTINGFSVTVPASTTVTRTLSLKTGASDWYTYGTGIAPDISSITAPVTFTTDGEIRIGRSYKVSITGRTGISEWYADTYSVYDSSCMTTTGRGGNIKADNYTSNVYNGWTTMYVFVKIKANWFAPLASDGWVLVDGTQDAAGSVYRKAVIIPLVYTETISIGANAEYPSTVTRVKISQSWLGKNNCCTQHDGYLFGVDAFNFNGTTFESGLIANSSLSTINFSITAISNTASSDKHYKLNVKRNNSSTGADLSVISFDDPGRTGLAIYRYMINIYNNSTGASIKSTTLDSSQTSTSLSITQAYRHDGLRIEIIPVYKVQLMSISWVFPNGNRLYSLSLPSWAGSNGPSEYSGHGGGYSYVWYDIPMYLKYQYDAYDIIIKSPYTDEVTYINSSPSSYLDYAYIYYGSGTTRYLPYVAQEAAKSFYEMMTYVKPQAGDEYTIYLDGR